MDKGSNVPRAVETDHSRHTASGHSMVQNDLSAPQAESPPKGKDFFCQAVHSQPRDPCIWMAIQQASQGHPWVMPNGLSDCSVRGDTKYLYLHFASNNSNISIIKQEKVIKIFIVIAEISKKPN